MPRPLNCTSDYAYVTKEVSYNGNLFLVIFDSGASAHFCHDQTKFCNYRKIKTEPIMAADGRTFDAIGKGDILVELPNGSERVKSF
jgi:hypothetical protein